jgi:homoserine O-acetyltransferase
MNDRNLAAFPVIIIASVSRSARTDQYGRTRRTVMSTLRFWILLTAVLVAHGSVVLAHWPDQPAHQMAYLGDLELESGGVVHDLKMSYVTHGTLNGTKDNAILFMHGWGLNHHQMDHLIGPGKAFDTEKYFIICSDELGSSQTTFEHSTSPTNSGLKMKFPQYNARDKIKAEYKLVTEGLGISHLVAVSGYSSGAGAAVQFAVSYPNFMDGIFPAGGGAIVGTQGFFYGSLYMSILESCKTWDAGNYEKNPTLCASNALSTFIPYFYTREWWDVYIDSPEAYTKWRSQWGEYYLDIQDARDLYYRMMAAGSGVGDTPGFHGDMNAALASIKARTLFIYNPRDQFYLPHHIETQVKAIRNASAVAIDSIVGHLICCNADPQATWTLSETIRTFLDQLTTQRAASTRTEAAPK